MVDKVKGWIASKDFEALYGAVDSSTALSASDKEELIPYILESATETLHEHIIAQTKVNFEKKSEHFMLRFLYEDAMNHYEMGENYEAQESLGLLSVISDSKHFEKSLRRHILALLEAVDFDTFVTQWVEPEDLKHFYISSFSKEVEKKYKDKSCTVDDAVVGYKKLFK